MDSERWQNVERLFHAAMECEESQRAAFLARACGGDEALLREVGLLVSCGSRAGRFIEEFAVEAVASALAGDEDEGQDNAANENREGTKFLATGQTISHYRVIRKLGTGGMGVVYEAEDIRLHRHVALKFLPDPLVHDGKALHRFQREALAASSLNHPNICTIYEVEEHEGQPVLVMELLEGESLKDRLHKGFMSTAELLDLGGQISDALAAAHAKGIIHRDIKPANIFMTASERVKVLDFGVAKAIASPQSDFDTDAESLTGEGVIVGTAAYMSPEQARGDEIDGRSDLFSLGVVLYEAATGQRPFAGKNRVLTMNAILNQEPVPPGQVNPELPARLDGIIAKALQKNPNLRYQDASEMRADLERVKPDTDNHLTSPQENGSTQPSPVLIASVVADPAIVPARSRPFLRMIWGATAFLVLIVLAAAGFWYRYVRVARGLTEKDTIVLADFANTTGDSIFDDTLKTALNVSLRQSPFLNVLSDSQVAKTLKMMTRPADTKLTPEVTRELCQRVGSKAYIAGTIGSLGSEYVLGLKVVDCQSGDTLAEEQVTAKSKEKVLDALGQAASRLRGELGESLATVQKFDVPLFQATTPSLEALQAYRLGLKAYQTRGAAASLPYYQRAIELDPNFAMGYWAVGGAYSELVEFERASEYFTKAFQLKDHASEWEKLDIAGIYYRHVTGELDKAARTYEEGIENYPRNAFFYASLATVYGEQGKYDKAAELLRQALRLAPSLVVYGNLANYALALQRFDEARQIVQAGQARKLDHFELHSALYALAFVGGDITAMAEQRQWFTGKPEESFGLALASDTEAYSGHLGETGKLAKRAVDSAIRADNKETGAIWQVNAALQQAAFGNSAEARQTAAKALKLAPKSPGVEVEAALTLAMAGNAARAESLAQDLGKRFPLDTQMQSLWLPAIQAQVALDRKNPASALNALQAALPVELGNILFINNLSCLYPVYVRGEAYLGAGQGTAAAAEFQKIIDHSGIVWNCWTGAIAHLGVARANALQFKISQGADADAARIRALAAYKDFLTLWKDADPDVPVLKEAKAEYAKLQ